MKIKINQKLIDDGYVTCRKHPEADYFIYNYTAQCQYNQYWDEQTKLCRGLILDKDNNVVARPFQKFFNIGEYNQHSLLGKLPNYNYFDVFEKMDGSLGILYQLPDGEYSIATRGSFESEQAKVAQEIWASKYNHDFGIIDNDYTYLFEIIYPDNRIVVDYKDKKDLVLLAGIHKETGLALDYEQLLITASALGCPMTQYYGRKAYNRHAFLKIEADIPEGAEGFVLIFDNGLRVKIKSEEYKRLHKILTGVSTKVIWELLRNDQALDDFILNVPDEFYKWVLVEARNLRGKYNSIENFCIQIISFLRAGHCISVNTDSMKEVALYFQSHPARKRYASVLFAMWKEKPYKDIIWKMIKPEYSQPFKKEI